jgi:hypothetical protein
MVAQDYALAPRRRRSGIMSAPQNNGKPTSPRGSCRIGSEAALQLNAVFD